MALPSFKLATVAAKLLKSHGTKIKDLGNQELTVKNLSDSLNSQLDTLKDPYTDNASTLLSLPLKIAEMQVLTAVTVKRLGIDVKGKGQFEKLQAIVEEMESTGSNAADELKDALQWSREYLTSPEMVELLSNEKAAIKLPESLNPKEILMVIPQSFMAIKDNVSTLNGFITIAKEKEKQNRQEIKRLKEQEVAKKNNPKLGGNGK